MLPAPALWATPTQFGDSGLISQPTADTHQSGSICVGLWSQFSTLKQAGSTEESTFLLPVSITLGLGSFIEAYGSYPNLTFNGDEGVNLTSYPVTGYSDRGYANLGLKTRILGSRSGPYRFSIDAQARRNVSDDPTVDGLTDYLARGILTLKYGMFGLHANGGMLMTDKVVDADHLVYGGGFEFMPSPRLRFMAEYSTMDYDGDDPLLSSLDAPTEASFGIQYHFSPHLAFSAAYTQGLSDFSPDWKTIIGFYTCQGTGTYIKPVTVVEEVPEEEVVAAAAEPVQMLQLNTLSPLATLTLPGADGIDPVSEFEVPVKAGEEEIIITPIGNYLTPDQLDAPRDDVDTTSADTPADDEAIPFTSVVAAAAGAAVTQVAPLPVAPPAVTAPQTLEQRVSGGRSFALREYIYSDGRIIGQKVEEEIDYNTYFLTLEPQGEFLVGEFYHDASRPLPVWVEGAVDYDLSFRELKPFTLTKIKVKMSQGQVPRFKLHIGDRSEVFQFGPPKMWSHVEQSEDKEDDGESLAATIGKGVLLAPVAVVAAPFAGAAYLAQKVAEGSADDNVESALEQNDTVESVEAETAATLAAEAGQSPAAMETADVAVAPLQLAPVMAADAPTGQQLQSEAEAGGSALEAEYAAELNPVAPAQSVATLEAADSMSKPGEATPGTVEPLAVIDEETVAVADTSDSSSLSEEDKVDPEVTEGVAEKTTEATAVQLAESDVDTVQGETDESENLAVTVGKGVLLAPVAVVAAPFVGAAYLAQQIMGDDDEAASPEALNAQGQSAVAADDQTAQAVTSQNIASAGVSSVSDTPTTSLASETTQLSAESQITATPEPGREPAELADSSLEAGKVSSSSSAVIADGGQETVDQISSETAGLQQAEQPLVGDALNIDALEVDHMSGESVDISASESYVASDVAAEGSAGLPSVAAGDSAALISPVVTPSTASTAVAEKGSIAGIAAIGSAEGVSTSASDVQGTSTEVLSADDTTLVSPTSSIAQASGQAATLKDDSSSPEQAADIANNASSQAGSVMTVVAASSVSSLAEDTEGDQATLDTLPVETVGLEKTPQPLVGDALTIEANEVDDMVGESAEISGSESVVTTDVVAEASSGMASQVTSETASAASLATSSAVSVAANEVASVSGITAIGSTKGLSTSASEVQGSSVQDPAAGKAMVTASDSSVADVTSEQASTIASGSPVSEEGARVTEASSADAASVVAVDSGSDNTVTAEESADEGENLAVTIGKGVLLAPVAVVAAPFAGAAYLIQKAIEPDVDNAEETVSEETSPNVVDSESINSEVSEPVNVAQETTESVALSSDMDVAAVGAEGKALSSATPVQAASSGAVAIQADSRSLNVQSLEVQSATTEAKDLSGKAATAGVATAAATDVSERPETVIAQASEAISSSTITGTNVKEDSSRTVGQAATARSVATESELASSLPGVTASTELRTSSSVSGQDSQLPAEQSSAPKTVVATGGVDENVTAEDLAEMLAMMAKGPSKTLDSGSVVVSSTGSSSNVAAFESESASTAVASANALTASSYEASSPTTSRVLNADSSEMNVSTRSSSLEQSLPRTVQSQSSAIAETSGVEANIATNKARSAASTSGDVSSVPVQPIENRVESVSVATAKDTGKAAQTITQDLTANASGQAAAVNSSQAHQVVATTQSSEAATGASLALGSVAAVTSQDSSGVVADKASEGATATGSTASSPEEPVTKAQSISVASADDKGQAASNLTQETHVSDTEQVVETTSGEMMGLGATAMASSVESAYTSSQRGQVDKTASGPAMVKGLSTAAASPDGLEAPITGSGFATSETLPAGIGNASISTQTSSGISAPGAAAEMASTVPSKPSSPAAISSTGTRALVDGSAADTSEQFYAGAVSAINAPQVAAVYASAANSSQRKMDVAPMAGAMVKSGPIPASGETMKTTVYRKYRLPEFTFEFGLSELSDEGRKALSMVMDRLRKMDKWFLVRIDGHTDSTGSLLYNEWLAMQRSISVAQYLVSNEGLNPEVVFLKGFGERKPLETNTTREGRQNNRRIELLVLIPKEN